MIATKESRLPPQRVLVHRDEDLLALCNFLVGGNVSAENQWRTDGSLERKVGFFSYSERGSGGLGSGTSGLYSSPVAGSALDARGSHIYT